MNQSQETELIRAQGHGDATLSHVDQDELEINVEVKLPQVQEQAQIDKQ